MITNLLTKFMMIKTIILLANKCDLREESTVITLIMDPDKNHSHDDSDDHKIDSHYDAGERCGD